MKKPASPSLRGKALNFLVPFLILFLFGCSSQAETLGEMLKAQDRESTMAQMILDQQQQITKLAYRVDYLEAAEELSREAMVKIELQQADLENIDNQHNH